MAGTKVQIKRSSVAGRVPSASDIEVGQLAINFTDNRFFTKDGSNTVIDVFGQSLNTTANVSFRDGAFANISATTLAGNLEWSYITTKPDLKIDITGDATGTNTFVDLANGAINITLANTAVTPGTYGNSSVIPVLTIDSKGRVTAATTNAVAGITGFSYTSSNNTLAITAGDGSVYKATVNTVNTFAVSNTLLVTGVGTFSNDVIVSGNLVVSGTTTYINTTELNIGDNIISLNADLTGTPSENAGVSINRGTSSNVALLWDESVDAWTFTNDGSTYFKIASNTDVDAAYANAASYADAKAANAYSNAVSYTDTKAAAAYSNATSYADTVAATSYANATSYADTVAATSYANATSYTDTKAAAAYSNAASYADTKAAAAYSNAVSIASADATDKASNAYSNAVSFATAAASAAYSNATSYADTKAAAAYSNAVSTAATDATNKAANAYSNAISYADSMAATAYSNAVSTAATDATILATDAYNSAVSAAASDASSKAATAYSNAVSTASADATSKAATAYSNAVSTAATDATNKAANAYSNAIAYAASNSYVNSTFAPLAGATFTGSVTFANTVAFGNTRITANGGVGTSGQVLMSGGASGNVYWSTVSLTDLNTTYTLSTAANTASANIVLTGSDSSTNTVKIIGAGGLNVSSNGTVITLDGSSITGGGGSSNSFGTFIVAGQANVVADQANDTLTLVAGSNMSITTNATSGAITFTSTASGGGGALGNNVGNAFISARDNFLGNGSNTAFTLSQTATSNTILVLVEGLVQFHNEDYDVSGTTLTFTTAPVNNEAIEVLHISGAAIYRFSQYGAIDSFTGNGSNTGYTLSRTANTSTATVYLDGLLQDPSTDFSISGTALTFTTAPLSGESILVYHVDSAATALPSAAITSSDTFTGDGTTTAFTLTATANSTTSFVTINGMLQRYTTDYSVTDLTLTFVDAPPSGASIQSLRLSGAIGASYKSVVANGVTVTAPTSDAVLNLAAGSGVSLSANASTSTVTIAATAVTKQSLTGNGSNTIFTLSSSTFSDNILVFVDGTYFHPDEDYTVSGTTITFSSAPIASAEIRIRFIR